MQDPLASQNAKMIRLITISTFVAFVWGKCEVTSQKLLCGKDTVIDNYPYHLSLEFKKEHICGASLINPTTALTAAHCTYLRNDEPFNYQVRAGSTYIDWKEGVTADVLAICQHGNYDNVSKDYDVSVLFLSKSLLDPPKINSVALQPESSEIFNDITGVVTGWNFINQKIQASSKLQEVHLKKLSSLLCQQLYRKRRITDRMDCYIETDTDNTCKGEYGNPLVVQGQQAGIASWVSEESCDGKSYPRVYTKISNINITKHIRSCMGSYSVAQK